MVAWRLLTRNLDKWIGLAFSRKCSLCNYQQSRTFTPLAHVPAADFRQKGTLHQTVDTETSTHTGVRSYSNRPKSSQRMVKSEAFIKFHNAIKEREDDFTMSLSEWQNLENEVSFEAPDFTPAFAYSVMKSLKDKPDLSVSFMTYIKSKGNPNMSTQLEFINNCAEKYEELALKEFELLRNAETFLTGFHTLHGSKLIMSIARTSKWKDGLELFETLYPNNIILHEQGITAISDIVQACVRNKDFEMFYKLSEKYHGCVKLRAQSVSDTIYNSWKQGAILVDVFIELLKTNEMPLRESQIRDFLNFCNKEWKSNGSAKLTRIHSQSCQCGVCQEFIPKIHPLDTALFDKMGKTVLSKIVMKDNIYKSTDPLELERFRQFMSSQNKPFDYIVDGLNVVLQKYSRQKGENYLMDILKRLRKGGQRVLVIFKKNPHLAREVERYATVFMTEHKSFDDIYMLLAAMLSGPKCYVVTNDDFRDHICLVDDPLLRKHLVTWRDQQRIFHNLGKLTYPPLYSYTAYESDGTWHIPYQKDVMFEKENTAHAFMQLSNKTFLCVVKRDYLPSPELIHLRKIMNVEQENLISKK